MLLARLLSCVRATLNRVRFAMHERRIESLYQQAAREAGIDASPGSLWDDLTKPNRLEALRHVQHLGHPA